MPTGDVSVVIPCYRSEQTVERAVRSALDQTLPAREILAVDDASPDGTASVLGRLAAAHPSLRVVRLERNGGPSAARNAGWAQAQGRYVAFLDADDLWHPRKLEIQLAFMQAAPEFALSAHEHTVGTPPEPSGEARATEIRLADLLPGSRFATSTVMLRRDLPQRYPEDVRRGEDYMLWVRIAAAGHHIARLELPLAARFEPEFGGAGLSGALWAFEKSELRNYRTLQKEGVMGLATLCGISVLSLAKFARRLAIVGLRRLG
jgi:glycosyltransferase involved in cell wall biosynthesis